MLWLDKAIDVKEDPGLHAISCLEIPVKAYGYLNGFPRRIYLSVCNVLLLAHAGHILLLNLFHTRSDFFCFCF